MTATVACMTCTLRSYSCCTGSAANNIKDPGCITVKGNSLIDIGTADIASPFQHTAVIKPEYKAIIVTAKSWLEPVRGCHAAASGISPGIKGTVCPLRYFTNRIVAVATVKGCPNKGTVIIEYCPQTVL